MTQGFAQLSQLIIGLPTLDGSQVVALLYRRALFSCF
jgi:hypothetical protein